MVCDRDSLATQVVDKIIEDSTEVPTPADIRRLGYAANAASKQPGPVCPECLGDGFLYAWRVRVRVQEGGRICIRDRSATLEEVKQRDAPDGEFYETTVDCVCRKVTA